MNITILVKFKKKELDKLQLMLFSLGYKWNAGETSPIEIICADIDDVYMNFDVDYESKSISYNTNIIYEDEYVEDFKSDYTVRIKYTNIYQLRQMLIHGHITPMYAPRKINKTI
jgi:hypothetical protein